jgi:hypothetical protein
MLPEMSTWRLGDTERYQQRAPDSFFIPPAAERRNLKPGDVVKLIFEFDELINGQDGERMWVQVTDIMPAGYRGTLLSQPY